MFCRCPNGFGGGENTQTCPVCLGFPGALPVANRTALEWTVKLGLALGCEIAAAGRLRAEELLLPRPAEGLSDLPIRSAFLHKRQGASADAPTATTRSGSSARTSRRTRRRTTHVGGRTGRIGGADYSLVDFNRGGTPLVEIVTGPDIHSAEDARRFLQLLRQTVVELGISDAEMEKGPLRVDANVSVRPAGSSELRTRCELKNMNSFRFVAQGIDAEVARQIELYESGGEVVQETYDFDAATGTLTAEALEGGGGRLPLLPRARPRAGRAVGRARRAAAGRAAGEPGGADPPDRGRARPRSRRRARHRRARRALAGDGRGRRRAGRRRERDREPARRRRRRDRRSRRAGEARRGARPDPAHRARRGARQGGGARASRPRRTSSRRPSRTPPSSSRSSRGSSTPTPTRSPPTAAARRACSASSSAR